MVRRRDIRSSSSSFPAVMALSDVHTFKDISTHRKGKGFVEGLT